MTEMIYLREYQPWQFDGTSAKTNSLKEIKWADKQMREEEYCKKALRQTCKESFLYFAEAFLLHI